MKGHIVDNETRPVVEAGYDDGPTSIEVRTVSGDIIDINNLPGVKRKELVANGELDADKLITPANMPGAKLKAMRDAHKAKQEGKTEHLTENPFVKGDMVIFRNLQVKVLVSDPVKGVRIRAKDGKKVWVSHTSVLPVTETEEEKEE